MRRRYEAFTLVEMLIVMGILIILMVIGVTAGRFAILRTQEAKHKDAVRTLYATLLKYKLDNGQFPELGNCTDCIQREMFAYALGYNGTAEQHILKPYMEGVFEGGSDATYYYAVDEYDKQFMVVCVSLGGIEDERQRGFFCEGSGIGMLPESNPIPRNDIGSQASGDPHATVVRTLDNSDWKPNDGGFWLSN